MERIRRNEFLETLQPVLDLFELDLTPRDVLGFRWVRAGETAGGFADALEIEVFSYDSEGKKSGVIAHRRFVGNRD